MSDEQAIEGGGLRVVFRRLADRFAHRVEWMACGGVISLVESIEGTADEDWPASPPLQELHFQRRAEGNQLALLVGRAGASHWSMSIELDPAAAQISFDVACRVRAAPGRLGSRYRRLDIACDQASAGQRNPLSMAELSGNWRLRPEGVERPSCLLCCHRNELELEPSGLQSCWPQTVRWQYALCAGSSGNRHMKDEYLKS